jgi:glyoxylase-like metal-dependent hydrolase (beta-lactamase superfamily II)
MVERIVVGPVFTNAYIYSEWKKECVIIDPGADPELIVSRLSLINMKPRGIALTHGHVDHTSAAGKLRDLYKEKGIDLTIAIHIKDRKFMGARSVRSHEAIFGPENGSGHENFDEAIHQMPNADIYLEDGDMLFEADLKAIHTPGHTAGSICIYSESQEILFSGDTLLFEDIGRTDLPGGSANAIIKNIREKVFTLPASTRVFPGHGPYTALEREIRHNPHFN